MLRHALFLAILGCMGVAGCMRGVLRQQIIEYRIPAGFRGVIHLKASAEGTRASSGDSVVVVAVDSTGAALLSDPNLMKDAWNPGMNRGIRYRYASGATVPFYITGLEKEVAVHPYPLTSGDLDASCVGTYSECSKW